MRKWGTDGGAAVKQQLCEAGPCGKGLGAHLESSLNMLGTGGTMTWGWLKQGVD